MGKGRGTFCYCLGEVEFSMLKGGHCSWMPIIEWFFMNCHDEGYLVERLLNLGVW